jgi:hypothetical protein
VRVEDGGAGFEGSLFDVEGDEEGVGDGIGDEAAEFGALGVVHSPAVAEAGLCADEHDGPGEEDPGEDEPGGNCEARGAGSGGGFHRRGEEKCKTDVGPVAAARIGLVRGHDQDGEPAGEEDGDAEEGKSARVRRVGGLTCLSASPGTGDAPWPTQCQGLP